MGRYRAKTNVLLGLSATLFLVSVGIVAAIPSARPAKAAALDQAIDATDVERLQRRHLAIPVRGIAVKDLRDNYEEGRGTHKHEALDILAPRGTSVIAVDDGRVAKLFTSAAGGITVYQFDPEVRFVYYYAHLDRYAEGLKEGARLKRGDTIGYVGTSGNAPKNTPHLHFTIFRVGPEKRWWKGTPVNPFPFLAQR